MRPHQPTPTPHMKGDNLTQRETRPLQSPRRRPHQPPPTPHMKGDNGRQDHFRAQEADHTNQHKAARAKVALRTPTVNCLGKNGARHVDLWHDVSQTSSCLHGIHPNDLCQIIRPHQTSRGILPKNTSSKFHPPYGHGGHLRPQNPVTCDHKQKTGFGSLVTTKCGHLRPQNVTFADRANKTSTVHAVTCDQSSRSLATKNWDHLASLGSLVPMHGVGGVCGGVGW